MTDPLRRPILRLKPGPPKLEAAPEPLWKCKPCGAKVELNAAAADEDVVRCGVCGARLGTFAAFRRPDTEKRVRARRIPTA